MYIVVLLTLFSLVLTAKPCFEHCRFEFCDLSTNFQLDGINPDSPFTSPICDKYGFNIGMVGESGEAYVKGENEAHFKRISRWNGKGMRQNFSRSFFKTFSIKGDRLHGNGMIANYYREIHGNFQDKYMYSAVGREMFHENQLELLHDKCIVLPLVNWLVLDNTGNVKYNIWSRNFYEGFKDCVAFRVV